MADCRAALQIIYATTSRGVDETLFSLSLFSFSLSLSSFLFSQCIPFARFAFILLESRTRQGEVTDSLSLSLFCDLISARIKHRRTDVHLAAAEKAVCESCRGRSWREGRPAELCARFFSFISLRFPYGENVFTFSFSRC